MKKSLLTILTITSTIFYSFSQQYSDLGTIVGMENQESTGFKITFEDQYATGGAWIDNNENANAIYGSDSDGSYIEITLPEDTTSQLNWWDRGDIQYIKTNMNGDGFIPFMLKGHTNISFSIKTNDTLYYWAKIDHTPWATNNPALEIGDTIKTIGKKIVINVNLPIPSNLTFENDLNSSFYNTLFLFLSTINRKSSTIKLYGIAVGDMADSLETTVSPIDTSNNISTIQFSDTTLSSTIHITSNSPWTASSDASWLSISKTNGSGNDSLIIIVEPNTTGIPRTATITITSDGLFSLKATQSQTITVTQEAEKGTTFNIEKTNKTLLYPNPTNQGFTLNNTEETSIEIYNTNSKLLKRIDNSKTNFISTQGLMPGVYIVKIITKNSIKTQSLIIK